MAKLIIKVLIIFNLMFIAISIVGAMAIAEDPKSVSNWFNKLSLKKEKVTKLHYYFHNTIGGNDATAVPVARANSTDSSPNSFGIVMVMDDPLTTGPDPMSPIVGRDQGIFASASATGETALLMTMNLVFTSGRYKGSTLSLLGRNSILGEYREMPIVGGTGVFRLARGIATAQNVYVNFTTRVTIVEYHVVVLHY